MNQNLFAKKPPLQLHILAALSLVGVGISIALTQHFYEIRNGTSSFKSFCNVSQTMNCDVIAASPYAEFIFGLPLSSFAAGSFLALFLMALVGYNPFWRRESIRAALGLTLIGSLFAFPYLWIMANQLKSYCLFCFVIDGLNWVSLGIVLSLKPERLSLHRPNWNQWKILLPLMGASLFAAIFALSTLNQISYKPADVDEVTQKILNTPPVPVLIGDQFPSIGPKNAPIKIVEFSDFQCPWCRVGAMGLNSVVHRYPTQIQIVFKNFPLDQACNPMMHQTPHPVACEAAQAGVCAHQQGHFESIYEKFFENQADFVQIHPTAMAKALPLDLNRFQSCMSSPETLMAIARDIEEGKTLGVTSTPTFYVNGHKVEGPQSVPVWNLLVERLLKNEVNR